MELLNAFTVDVEDYFQVSGFEKQVSRDTWETWGSRVVANTHRLLQLLDRHRVKATFCVLGWTAERYPRLVQEIQGCGHEIGSHGYWHHLIYEQSPEDFRADLRRSRAVLENAISQRIRVYRAPSFSITQQSRWALEILVEEGYSIDSSVFPIRHDRYGMPGAEMRLHRLSTPAGPLWEFPPAVLKLAGMKVPIGGGGYFRLYPLSWTLFGLRQINGSERRPFAFYVHPWEIDPQQPRISARSRLSRFRHYVNLASNEEKLGLLLQAFRFGRLSDVVAEASAKSPEAMPADGVSLAKKQDGRQPAPKLAAGRPEPCRSDL